MSLRERIIHDISKNEYECIICYEKITARVPIWSCSACYRVMDLKCVKNWADRDKTDQDMFKCPHCRVLQKRNSSFVYRCWCKKDVLRIRNSSSKARNKSLSSLPHSCGQTCGAKRACPHPCPLTCHPGSHLDSAECMHVGPVISCFCRKSSEQLLCSETRYQGFSCGSSCGLKNPVCGHRCSLTCHKALGGSKGRMIERCGPCTEQVQVACKCGKLNGSQVPCSSLSSDQRNSLKRGSSSVLTCCDIECGKLFDCGLHTCSIVCHSKDVHICPLKPFEGEKCFCGKHLANRVTCSEPKTSCGSPCGKQLDCGHQCKSVCHDSQCPPCCEIVEGVSCRCERSTLKAVCGDLNVSEPLCERKCGAVLICGRHHCRRLCCEFNPNATGSLKAQRRASHNLQARLMTGFSSGNLATSKKKRSRLRRTPDDDRSTALSDEAWSNKLAENDSEIMRIDSLLVAANDTHSCSRLCDRMLPCGTHGCFLPCHSGPCPPCHSTSFDEWQCPCGLTKVLPPIRCGTVMPSCTKSCHRPQHCGHQATHTCHSDSVQCSPCTMLVEKLCRCGKDTIQTHCSNTNIQCRKPCGQKLKCGHPCEQFCCRGSKECPPCSHRCEKTFDDCNHKHLATCHYPDPCPQECFEQLLATCPCGCLTSLYDCGEEMEIGCNQTCILESYSTELLNAYDHEQDWLSRLEAKVSQVVSNEHQKTVWFSPMSSYHRNLLHLLLRHYGMKSESLDSGPMRSVRGIRTPETRVPKFKLRNAPRRSPQLAIPRVVWQLNPAGEGFEQEAWLTGLFANQSEGEADDNKSSTEPDKNPDSTPESHQASSKPPELEKNAKTQGLGFNFLALRDLTI